MQIGTSRHRRATANIWNIRLAPREYTTWTLAARSNVIGLIVLSYGPSITFARLKKDKVYANVLKIELLTNHCHGLTPLVLVASICSGWIRYLNE